MWINSSTIVISLYIPIISLIWISYLVKAALLMELVDSNLVELTNFMKLEIIEIWYCGYKVTFARCTYFMFIFIESSKVFVIWLRNRLLVYNWFLAIPKNYIYHHNTDNFSLRANKNGFNLFFHFNIRGKLSMIGCNK